MPSRINAARLTELEQAAQDGLQVAAREGLVAARERAPKDTGRLRRSSRVVLDEDGGAVIRFTAPHAYLQHENLDFKHPDGGEAKFLENAVFELDVGGILAAVIAQEVDGG